MNVPGDRLEVYELMSLPLQQFSSPLPSSLQAHRQGAGQWNCLSGRLSAALHPYHACLAHPNQRVKRSLYGLGVDFEALSSQPASNKRSSLARKLR